MVKGSYDVGGNDAQHAQTHGKPKSTTSDSLPVTVSAPVHALPRPSAAPRWAGVRRDQAARPGFAPRHRRLHPPCSPLRSSEPRRSAAKFRKNSSRLSDPQWIARKCLLNSSERPGEPYKLCNMRNVLPHAATVRHSPSALHRRWHHCQHDPVLPAPPFRAFSKFRPVPSAALIFSRRARERDGLPRCPRIFGNAPSRCNLQIEIWYPSKSSNLTAVPNF